MLLLPHRRPPPPLLSGIYFTLFSILVNVFSMNKKQINNNNNDQVLDGYVIKLRLIVELHITHPRLENTAVSTKVVPQKR